MRSVVAAIALLATVGAVAQQEQPPEQAQTPFVREDVTAVAEQLACYCGCPHMQVSTCFCGTADSIREDIARQLDEGRSAEEVIAAYVEEHGTWGLAVPPKEGFNLVIWTLPAALILGGAVLVFLLGARWSRFEGEDGSSAGRPSAGTLDPAQRERLERMIAEED
jgi:cytochrome c-type biogenesis protein CcmH